MAATICLVISRLAGQPKPEARVFPDADAAVHYVLAAWDREPWLRRLVCEQESGHPETRRQLFSVTRERPARRY